jgi:ATP-dependent RNA helicase TDRD9
MSAEDLIVFKVVVAGAFYPNFFSCVYPDERVAIRNIGGRDPTTTVVVQGMPENGHLYHESLVRVFKTCGKGKQLHFDGSK